VSKSIYAENTRDGMVAAAIEEEAATRRPLSFWKMVGAIVVGNLLTGLVVALVLFLKSLTELYR